MIFSRTSLSSAMVLWIRLIFLRAPANAPPVRAVYLGSSLRATVCDNPRGPMSRKGEAERRRSEASQGLEAVVHEFPGPVRDAAIRLLYSFESDTLPGREDLALVLVHLVDREKARRQPVEEKKKKPKKVVRSEPIPQREIPRRREEPQVRSAFHERIQDGSAPEGPVSRLVRRRLGVSSNEKGRRQTEDGE